MSLAINVTLSAVGEMSVLVLMGASVGHTIAMPHDIFALILRVDLDGRLKWKYYGWNCIGLIQNGYVLWGTPFMSFFLLSHRSILESLFTGYFSKIILKVFFFLN